MTLHAKLSASGSQRWMNCPASVRMEEGLPDQSSTFAEEGSAAHALAEMCLRDEEHADKHIGETVGGYVDYPVTEEMAEAVQLYLDYVRDQGGEMWVEQRVDFSPWVPDGFGTADAIVMHEGLTTVVDLKYGKGVKVDAENNTQAMLYALGALNEYDFLYDCESFKLVIVQPRLDHVSEWIISRDDLIKWADDVKKKAFATQAEDAPFNPGESQCRWCKAKATCKALAEHSLKLAAEDFEAVDAPVAVKDATKLTNDEIATLLPQLGMLTTWVKSVEAHALAQLEQGHEVPGYKLVVGRSIRKWGNEDEAEKALKASKLKASDLFIKKLISPTQAEKLLGKDNPIFQTHVVKPEGRPTIAPLKDKRPAIVTELGQDFQDVA